MSSNSEPSRPFDVGVIGVGALGEAIVTGLSEGPDAPRVLVSGRSAERSSRLAATYVGVEVDADNQSLVDRARLVILAVRPQDALRTLEPLRFGPDHQVVSVMAALRTEDLVALTAPAASVCRAIPHVGVARRAVATPVFPANDPAREVFEPLGGVIAIGSETELDVVSVASATVAAHLRYVASIADWMTEHGVARDQSRRFLGGIFAETAHELRDGPDAVELAAAHATPGGLNERFVDRLREAGVYSAIDAALDGGLEAVRGSGLTAD